jgi:hypothetical protein
VAALPSARRTCENSLARLHVTLTKIRRSRSRCPTIVSFFEARDFRRSEKQAELGCSPIPLLSSPLKGEGRDDARWAEVRNLIFGAPHPLPVLSPGRGRDAITQDGRTLGKTKRSRLRAVTSFWFLRQVLFQAEGQLSWLLSLSRFFSARRALKKLLSMAEVSSPRTPEVSCTVWFKRASLERS